MTLPEFRLDDGEQVALVGGSGTGKTTLLHLIAGILMPDSGRICFGRDGEAGAIDIASLSEAHRDQFRGRYIGYIFQTHHLLGGFSALENVLLGMSFTGRKPDPKWANYLLQEVGLADRLNSSRPGCRWASSNGLPWPGHWRTVRRLSWRMSRPVPWIQNRATGAGADS